MINLNIKTFGGSLKMNGTENRPAIVNWGGQFINDYPEDEFRSFLIRAFKDGKANFVILDSDPHGQKFRAAGIAWAMNAGLVYNDNNLDDGQQVVSSFRLTELGERIIL